MPHDMFGDVAVRPLRVRSRTSSLVLFSSAAHVIAVVGFTIAQVFIPGPLPVPHTALAFEESVPVKLVDIELPSPPHRTAVNAASAPAVSPNAAPVVAPTGIAPERMSREPIDVQPSRVGEIENGEVGVLTGSVGAVTGPPPPPPLPPVRPTRVHAGMRAPVKIVDVAPRYPALAQAARVQGVVVIEAIIDDSGRVESARILRSVPLLDQAALEAVRQWRYTPGMLNGTPAAVIITVTVNFTLR